MGDIPKDRATLKRPFYCCGIDYAGPVSVLKYSGRGAKTTKEYIVICVCFATKALHLELQEIEWHTIPPLSPHFGGLWEAGVKLVKFHLKRVVVGEEIIGPPETVDESKLTLKGRWDIVQKLKLNFWKRWQIDYLNSIQGKTKWKSGTSKIKIGDVVIIKENNLPPSVWPLGKVISTHPGKLDKETRKNYELNLTSTELPKWEDFMNFLLKRCLILENIQTNNATAFPSERIYKTKSFLAKLDPANCVICKQSHLVFRCKKFNDLSVNERFNSVKRNRLCIDCFIPSHKVALCKSSRNCPNCSKRHNSLLCRNFERNLDSQRSPGSETMPNMEPRVTTPYLNVNSECFQPKQTIESFENGGEFVGYSKGASTMLLSTAVVYCQNSRGELFPLRALLDSGSQSNLITHEAAFALGLKCERVNTSICGVNGTPQFIKNKVSTVVSSKNRQFQK
ncbi:DUF5641 domain-containing protein [Trichonephila clavipes]|nr:DUF5641 domain-containing protein [Trichonephila clavipes]